MRVTIIVNEYVPIQTTEVSFQVKIQVKTPLIFFSFRYGSVDNYTGNIVCSLEKIKLFTVH